MDPTVTQTRPHFAAWALFVAATMAMFGCAADTSNSAAGGAPTNDGEFDGSGGSGGDLGGAGGPGAPAFEGVGRQGLSDNPLDLLFADPARGPLDPPSMDGAEALDYATAADGCYASSEACGAPECAAFAACCVDTTACCEPVASPALPSVVAWDACAGETADECASGANASAATFGPSEPVLTGRGLVPNGGATSDGGVVLGEPVDAAASALRIHVVFSLPINCNGTCLESAGVTLSASEPGAFVDAEVGLLLSGSREVVNLMVGGVAVDAFDAGSDGTTWTLALSPQGVVEVLRDGTSVGTSTFDASALTSAQLVLYGRNLGAAASSAAIASVEVESLSCDSPRGWTDREPFEVFLQDMALPPHAVGASPSIETDGSTWVAYALEGEIYVAERTAPDALTLDSPTPALVVTESGEAGGLADPELVSDGESLHLFYTARDSDGVGSIGVAISPQDPLVFVKEPAPTLAPEGDVVSFDAPTVVYRDGLWLMVVRATSASGATSLRAYYTSFLASGWTRVINGALETLTEVSDPTTDVTDPSLIVHNSAYQLYYARRVGTRWSIELAVSDELVLWRSIGEALGGSGAGFDALGGRSPDAISGPGRIDLVYSGQDGVSFRLGAATRAAPSESAPSVF